MYRKVNSMRERLLIIIDSEIKNDNEKKRTFQHYKQSLDEEIYIEFIESYSGLRTENNNNDFEQRNNITFVQSTKKLSEASTSTTTSSYVHSILETGEVKRKKSLKIMKSLSYKKTRKVIHKTKSADISSNGCNLLERFTQYNQSNHEK